MRNHNNDDQDQKRQPERVTLAQDGYPASWSFGTFGSAYRRTWFGKPNNAVPT